MAGFGRRGHVSGSAVAGRLERPTRGSSGAGRTIAPYLALLPVGFAVPPVSPRGRCALTAPFHPCLSRLAAAIGGLLSVALSLALRPVAVSDHRALWSSDFPPGPEGPSGRITRSPDSVRIIPQSGAGARRYFASFFVRLCLARWWAMNSSISPPDSTLTPRGTSRSSRPTWPPRNTWTVTS